VAAFAEKRQVIALELQGHGRTADIDRPLSYEAMADDIAALISYLGLRQADLLGWSLGGATALQTGIRHPQSVRKLVVVSQPFKRQGWFPEVLAGMAQMTPESAATMKDSHLSRLYPEVDWARLFVKLADLLKKEYDWSKEVAAIRVPTMLVYADADSVRGPHIMEFYGLLGGGQRDAGLDGSQRPVAQLAILPGHTHYDIGLSPVLPGVVNPFLEAPLGEPIALRGHWA
jgi:pimeloyl-ACP methyl ester carboxylesterase